MGEIKGTPTIKFIRPAKKNKKDSNKKKTVVDYNGERKFDAMLSFATTQMPSYVVRVNGEKDLTKFIAKADGYTLPKAILVTKETSTTPVAKALSTEYRRRLLVAEVRASKPNKDIITKYGLDGWLADKKGEQTVLVAVKSEGADDFNVMSKDGSPAKFTMKAAKAYLSKVALSQPYFDTDAFKAKEAASDGGAGESKAKTEL